MRSQVFSKYDLPTYQVRDIKGLIVLESTSLPGGYERLTIPTQTIIVDHRPLHVRVGEMVARAITSTRQIVVNGLMAPVVTIVALGAMIAGAMPSLVLLALFLRMMTGEWVFYAEWAINLFS